MNWLLSKQWDISHIKKRVVESLKIHLKQVTKQRKRFRSWRLCLLFLGAEAGVKKVEHQQDHNGPQSSGLEKKFQHDPALIPDSLEGQTFSLNSCFKS